MSDEERRERKQEEVVRMDVDCVQEKPAANKHEREVGKRAWEGGDGDAQLLGKKQMLELNLQAELENYSGNIH